MYLVWKEIEMNARIKIKYYEKIFKIIVLFISKVGKLFKVLFYICDTNAEYSIFRYENFGLIIKLLLNIKYFFLMKLAILLKNILTLTLPKTDFVSCPCCNIYFTLSIYLGLHFHTGGKSPFFQFKLCD